MFKSCVETGSRKEKKMIQAVELYNRSVAGTITSSTAEAEKTNFASVLEESSAASKTSTSTQTNSMDDIFYRASEKYQVPVNLLKAVAKTESNFNPDAISSCGAIGVMQLMPSTAAGLGVTDPKDPEQNIMGGAKYLSQMLDRYDGDVKLCLAAYNAGAGNVAKYGGVPPFKETQAYVERVMKYMGEDVETPSIINNTQTKVQTQKEPLRFTVRNSDKTYTYDDYTRFIALYREQIALSQLEAIYQKRY